jgi:hypothetical protein
VLIPFKRRATPFRKDLRLNGGLISVTIPISIIPKVPPLTSTLKSTLLLFFFLEIKKLNSHHRSDYVSKKVSVSVKRVVDLTN